MNRVARTAPRSHAVERALADPGIHRRWEIAYRTERNERFYELVFSRLLELIAPPPGVEFLDVGCGTGFHAIRLARRGYRVLAVDCSETVLALARENVQRAGLAGRVTLAKDNLMALSLPSGAFSYVLCWGVLMHIPALESALSELARVLAPSGTIMISEGNARSPNDWLYSATRRLQGQATTATRTSWGVERWTETPAGPVMTRRSDLVALTDALARRGLTVTRRLPGQLTEAYAWRRRRAPDRIERILDDAIHSLNEQWFRFGRCANLAATNVLIARKVS